MDVKAGPYCDGKHKSKVYFILRSYCAGLQSARGQNPSYPHYLFVDAI
jgi:hypothetical protein